MIKSDTDHKPPTDHTAKRTNEFDCILQFSDDNELRKKQKKKKIDKIYEIYPMVVLTINITSSATTTTTIN